MQASKKDSLVEVRDTVLIHAPLDRVWSLSTRVELVREILGMQLAGGVTQGFIQAGSRVVWRGWKFGLPTRHHTLITGFTAPRATVAPGPPGDREAWFQDTQEQGRFASFVHDHSFAETLAVDAQPLTRLNDCVRFSLPLLLGNGFTARLVLQPYVRKLLRKRFATIKELAEGEGWRHWL